MTTRESYHVGSIEGPEGVDEELHRDHCGLCGVRGRQVRSGEVCDDDGSDGDDDDDGGEDESENYLYNLYYYYYYYYYYD